MLNQNMLGNLWDTVKGWAQRSADQYSYVPIPQAQTDGSHSDEPLQPMRSYFRLWLNEMFLTDSRRWFQDWYPSVHSSVRLKFGDHQEATFSRIARAPEAALSKGVLLNHHLTELLPFNGGRIEVEAALLALRGTNHLNTAIDVLQDFSSLIAAPLEPMLSVAQKVSSGIEKLLGAEDGHVHLGLHQTLIASGGGGANVLKPGYIAIILATSQQVAAERLRVRGDRLYYSANSGAEVVPFQGYDYMLLRVEGREERDDYRMKNIQQPLDQAITALLEGDSKKAEAMETAALTAAMLSPDLAVHDRRRVVQAIRDELSQFKEAGHGATGGEAPTLNDIMSRHAMPAAKSAALGEMTFEEAFGDGGL